MGILKHQILISLIWNLSLLVIFLYLSDFHPVPVSFHLSSEGTHWGGNDDKGVEATGYALSALVTLGELKRSEAVSDWLVAKSQANGQFGNTQVTTQYRQKMVLLMEVNTVCHFNGLRCCLPPPHPHPTPFYPLYLLRVSLSSAP